jgi:hypothetical protein
VKQGGRVYTQTIPRQPFNNAGTAFGNPFMVSNPDFAFPAVFSFCFLSQAPIYIDSPFRAASVEDSCGMRVALLARVHNLPPVGALSKSLPVHRQKFLIHRICPLRYVWLWTTGTYPNRLNQVLLNDDDVIGPGIRAKWTDFLLRDNEPSAETMYPQLK